MQPTHSSQSTTHHKAAIAIVVSDILIPNIPLRYLSRDATFFLGEAGLFGDDGFLGEAGLFKLLGAPASPPRTRCNSMATSRLLTSGKSQGEG